MFAVVVNHGMGQIKVEQFKDFADAIDFADDERTNIEDHGGYVDIDVVNSDGRVVVSFVDEYSFDSV